MGQASLELIDEEPLQICVELVRKMRVHRKSLSLISMCTAEDLPSFECRRRKEKSIVVILPEVDYNHGGNHAENSWNYQPVGIHRKNAWNYRLFGHLLVIMNVYA